MATPHRNPTTEGRSMARQPRSARLAPLAALAALTLALPLPFAAPAAAQSPSPAPSSAPGTAPGASPNLTDQAPDIPFGGPQPAANTRGTISAATDAPLADDLPASLLTADDLPDGFSSQDG